MAQKHKHTIDKHNTKQKKQHNNTNNNKTSAIQTTSKFKEQTST